MSKSAFTLLSRNVEIRASTFERCNFATDGAPAMTGCHKGFIAYLKNKISDVLAVHCVIHRQHLVARNLSEKRVSFKLSPI